ncbi:MAG: M20/M25/M40 family metallo-hydrolase [Bacillota bacterium]|nr:M20/M25/M40 family metallo-hydrolase [Bacillota bacterium]
MIGSKGNKKAEEYIANIYKNLGLSPMFNNSYYEKYYQEVIPIYGESSNTIKTETVNNIVGVIKGNDSKKAVVISAHFDHIGYINGKIIRGALDNASGTSAIIEIAKVLKEKSCKKAFNMDIIICAFNGEEEGQQGSRAFVHDVESLYDNIYNINIDSIGAKEGGELTLKYKIKISSKLYTAMKTTIKNDNIKFSESSVEGATDSNSFQYQNIPSISLVDENVKTLVHKPTDTPEILDYEKIKIISDCICDFVQKNDGMIFK